MGRLVFQLAVGEGGGKGVRPFVYVFGQLHLLDQLEMTLCQQHRGAWRPGGCGWIDAKRLWPATAVVADASLSGCPEVLTGADSCLFF